MRNRITTLFELDELFSFPPPPAGSVARPPKRAPRKARRARRGEKHSQRAAEPDRRRGTRARAFDYGDPIELRYGAALVRATSAPSRGAEPDPYAAFDQSVEPFELAEDGSEDGADDSVRVADEPDARKQSAPVARTAPADEDGEAEPDESTGETDTERQRTERIAAAKSQAQQRQDERVRAFEAEMRALAERQEHGTEPSTTTPPAAGAPASPPISPLGASPGRSPYSHEIFDEMAKGMSYATTFKLPPVELKTMFREFDRELDAEAARAMVRATAQAEPVQVDPALALDPATLAADVLAMERREAMRIPPPVPASVVPLGTPPVRAASTAPIDIRHEVQLVPQQTGYSCWAAGAAMLVGWRDRISIDPAEIARANGYWAQYKQGLHPEDTSMFQTWGLTPEHAQTYTVQGFAELLERFGPLWAASAEPGPHIRVVTGIAGDGTAAGTTLFINDPWEAGMKTFRLPNHGSQYTETYEEFVRKQSELGHREMQLQGIYVAHL